MNEFAIYTNISFKASKLRSWQKYTANKILFLIFVFFSLYSSYVKQLYKGALNGIFLPCEVSFKTILVPQKFYSVCVIFYFNDASLPPSGCPNDIPLLDLFYSWFFFMHKLRKKRHEYKTKEKRWWEKTVHLNYLESTF